jgi:hypothetical protein
MSRRSRIRCLRRSAPNRLPLRPLATLGRRAPRLVKPRSQYRRVTDNNDASAGEIGADGVDAQAEQAARHQARLGGADVLVGNRSIAVLENLYTDDERVRRPVRQRGQVAHSR